MENENLEPKETHFSAKTGQCPLCNHKDWHLSSKHPFFKDFLLDKIRKLPFCTAHQPKFKAFTCNYCGNTILLNSHLRKEFSNHLPMKLPCVLTPIVPIATAFGLIAITGGYFIFKITKHVATSKQNAYRKILKRLKDIHP